jgi:hypothetical protein
MWNAYTDGDPSGRCWPPTLPTKTKRAEHVVVVDLRKADEVHRAEMPQDLGPLSSDLAAEKVRSEVGGINVQ